jgi:hypothetical protein
VDRSAWWGRPADGVEAEDQMVGGSGIPSKGRRASGEIVVAGRVGPGSIGLLTAIVVRRHGLGVLHYDQDKVAAAKAAGVEIERVTRSGSANRTPAALASHRGARTEIGDLFPVWHAVRPAPRRKRLEGITCDRI